MAFTNYSDLQTSIAEFLNRDDLTAKIPDFIILAEAQMNAELRHWRMEKRATATLDSQYTAVPTDFIQPVRFAIVGDQVSSLAQTDSKTITDLRTANNNPSGRPTEYSILDGSIEVYPNPDATYTLELLYFLAFFFYYPHQSSIYLLQDFHLFSLIYLIFVLYLYKKLP